MHLSLILEERSTVPILKIKKLNSGEIKALALGFIKLVVGKLRLTPVLRTPKSIYFHYASKAQ